MGFTKNDYWPFLIVDSSTEMVYTTEVQGKDDIIKYFLDLGLIRDYCTHSAYEKQGLQWINDKAIPVYDLLKHTLRGKLQYYFTSKNFRYQKSSYEASVILRGYLWKLYK